MAIAVTCSHCGARLRFKGEYEGRTAKCLSCSQPLVVTGEKIPDHDVFISHSSKDKPVADAVCAALELRHIRCWIAPRDLLPGHVWAGDLPDAIAGARIMVLIFSANSNNSQQVLREVDVAVKENTIIVPFRIEAAEMSKAMSFYISAAHWLDAMNGPLETHIATLVDTVRKLLLPSAPAATMMNAPRPIRTAPAVGALAAPAPVNPSPAAPASTPKRGWGALIAMLIILCAAVGGGVYWWQQQQQQSQPPPQSQSPPPSPPTTAVVQQPSPAPVIILSPPSASTLPAVVSSQPRHIDLLRLVDLDRDIFWGHWTLTREGLTSGTLAVPKRIRFPYHPPEEYDFAIDFTIQDFAGDDDFSQLCSAGDHDFAWIMATAANTVFSFSRLGDKPKDNPTAKLAALTKGQQHHSVVQVRSNGIKAFLDGRQMSSCPTARSLSEEGEWNIGNNVLGLCTYDAVSIQKAEVIEINSPGHIIERLDSSKVGTTKWPLARPAGTSVSLTTLTPRSVLVYTDHLRLNEVPEGDKVIVDGKPCTRFIFAHADSSLLYDIPSGAIGLRASAVSGSDNKAFYCVVFIDGDEVMISHNVGESNGQIDIQLPIPPGSRKIELQFHGSRQRLSAHSIWANPEFVFAAR